jgi:arylformamidase
MPKKGALDYIDISPLLSSRTAVFPGDRVLERKVSRDYAVGSTYLLSQIETTVHLGAHVDAPNHYHPQGSDIASRALDYYYGKCQVITVRLPRGERILPEHLQGTPIQAQRVLFHTGSFPNPDAWNGDFNSLSPELVRHLSREGVRLVGIDTPSVDPADDAEMRTHQSIYAHDMAVLEGIVLDQAPDGIYRLIALPLRLEGADASPVRAILMREL